MGEALVVEQAGQVTLQDLGRPGLAALGVSANGAADAHSARIANVLVGNPAGAPLIEATASSFAFRARRRLLLAVTGAVGRFAVGGVPCPAAEPVVVDPGCPVRIEAAAAGARLYLALNGRISAEPVLGSVAPDRALGLGRRLAPGDVVGLDSRFTGLDHPFSRVPLFRLGAPRPVLGPATTVDVTPGPDAAEFDEGWAAGTFTVEPLSDAVGLRLTGPVPPRTRSAEILSRGVPVGAVEVPPAGGLIVLLRGRFVTAGYPIVAVAATTALDRLGQVRPGDRLTFRLRTAESTRAELREREQRLAELAARVARAYRHVGLADVVHEDHLSSAPVPGGTPRPRTVAAAHRGGPAG
jgi:biotin-dependent carboxylase-like uncharacterized protein